jgi:catechol 1,2-dioxygenase
MIVANQTEVTAAVLRELERAPDARFRELLGAAVRHLHNFAREVKLTELEYFNAVHQVARMGQLTNASHNEVLVVGGVIGMASLVCLLNNGDNGQTDTTANMMGPFWRMGSPREANGASIVRAPTVGDPLFIKGQVCDLKGRPIAGVEVDVWHTSAEGYYENHDPQQADMNLRGQFTTDQDGRFSLRSVKPAGYPIPVDGPAGDILRAQGRHNMRPAHIHLMLFKSGYKTQFSQVYSSDDPHLDTDCSFGVTRALIGNYVRHESGQPPAPDVQGAWYTLEHRFLIEPGVAGLPKPPITGKLQTARPESVRLPDQRQGSTVT